MNNSQILAAALRWHRAHTIRLEAGTANNKFKADEKRRTGFGGSDRELSARVTAAKRVELGALRTLARVIDQVRSNQNQVDDAAEVFDVEVKMLT